MGETVADYRRSEASRIAAIRKTEASQRGPRLWAPLYLPNTTYIAFVPSALTCNAPFPNPEYATYKDYMLVRHSFSVDPNCRLVCAQNLWTEPRKMTPVTRGTNVHPSTCAKRKKQKTEKNGLSLERRPQEGEISPCHGLRAVLLPEDACMEAPLADAALYLHCILLPQILYELNRYLTASAFIKHCCTRFDKLGEYLSQVQLDSVAEILTARSCSLDCSYDRLEYLGDAVLKLLHTDVLIQSSTLKQWTKCLHEGDLSKLRSEMGCNERLSKAARSAGIERFILTMPLARGLWAPNGFVRREREESEPSISDKVVNSDCIEPSMKVCADVVEALLGLIYTQFGYKASAEVAEMLLISPSVIMESDGTLALPISFDRSNEAELFVGHHFGRESLAKEALTHGSYQSTDVPSYQKLEWVGDAVLCLAVREWAFVTYPTLPVADLVTIETTVVCNETLACIAVRNGVHGLINHADPSLPGRIENFALTLREEEWGLWGSNPPKVLADVVEALLGACHVDGGFRVGQQSTLFVVKPVLQTLKATNHTSECGSRLLVKEGAMMHPKQVLTEMGSFLKVRVCAEADAAKEPAFPLWRKTGWSQALSSGNDTVCRVTCLGVHLGAVVESSSIVARNRGCAIISEVLRRNPKLLGMMHDMSSKFSSKDVPR
mmetsp:Transcript_4940/g.14103  ORF Transcript_4940/g.14103 Transcript_4940/m.14103 type:complete len:664 (-) Transcript_4940:96-2087(-)